MFYWFENEQWFGIEYADAEDLEWLIKNTETLGQSWCVCI
jgi:hypothetical protein